VKDQRVYLGHIRDAIDDIATYAAVGRDAFMVERMRQDAVIRKLEIIGEAVKQLSDETKQRRPEIPWKQIAGMRDRLTHAYFGVDLGLIWVVVERDLGALATAVTALLSDDQAGSGALAGD
jgi:uncharacterized protein with HEPN domain